jgi:hypothetical protein
VTDLISGETFEAQIEKTTFTKATPTDPKTSNQGFIELVVRRLS